MPKVDSIKLQIDNKEYKYNINCRPSDGQFNITLDKEVAHLLGIKNRIEGKELLPVKNFVLQAYRDFLNSSIETTLHIWIDYKSTGGYTLDESRNPLVEKGIGHTMSTPSNWSDLLMFDFGVLLCETSNNGGKTWYAARQKKAEVQGMETPVVGAEDNWVKHIPVYDYNIQGKIIDYSYQAYLTLLNAKEGIRRISETLYNVVSQSESDILASLSVTSNKLIK